MIGDVDQSAKTAFGEDVFVSDEMVSFRVSKPSEDFDRPGERD